MARLRKVESVLSELPDELKGGRWQFEPWFDALEVAPGDLSEEATLLWRLLQARRRWQTARRLFLASVRVRPSGVSALEFLGAHGISFKETDLAKNKGLSI